jgi:outer membrane protein assembly factor BamD (BamD/ComL family)
MKRLLFIGLCLTATAAMAFQGAGRGGKLVGRVLDLKGEGIEGAKMKVVVEGVTIPYEYDSETKKGGTFSFSRMPSGKVVITISKEGFESGVYNYDAIQETREMDFRMMRPGQTTADLETQPLFTGGVWTTSGELLPGVSLTMTSTSLPGFKREFTSGDTGMFEVEGLAYGNIEIYAKKEGYRDGIFRFPMDERPYEMKEQGFVLQTLEEAYKELGIEPPKPRELTNEEKAVDLYNEAITPYQAEDWAAAKEIALKAYELDPKQEATLKMLTYIGVKQENWPDALKYSEEFLKVKPDDKNMLEVVAEAARLTGNTEKQEKYFEEVRQARGITPDSLYNEAVQAINANNDTLAKTRLLEVLERNDKHADAYLQLGRIFIREGDFDEGVKNLKIFLKNAPENHKERNEVTELVIALSE